MIARMWHRRVATEKSAAYRAFLAAQPIAGYRSVSGNVSVHLILLLFSTLLLSSACVSSVLPARLSTHQAAEVATVRFAAAVAVEEGTSPEDARYLLERLRATGMFARVEPLAKLPQPDLIARVERHLKHQALDPFVKFIPRFVEDEHGHEFSLRHSRGSEAVRIVATYSGTTTLGWIAVLKNLLPGHRWGDLEQSERYLWFLRAKLAERRAEIERLLGSP